MSEPLYNVQQVANFFLAKGEEEGRGLSSLKLLKLVYIGYGWVLALTGRRLFSEKIQAWQHGPVVPALYHEFKHYRSDPISEKAVSFDLDSLAFTEPTIPDSDKETRLILERVWEAHKSLTGWSLRNMTHEVGSPWHSVYNELDRDTVISDELIAPYFKERIGEYLNVRRTAQA